MFFSFCYIYKDFVRQLKAFPPSFCHFCSFEMSPGWGHLITWMGPSVGHLNGILGRVGGNLNNIFQKSQMPGGVARGGMLKLRFDRYIIWITLHADLCRVWRKAWVPEISCRDLKNQMNDASTISLIIIICFKSHAAELIQYRTTFRFCFNFKFEKHLIYVPRRQGDRGSKERG